MVFEKDTDGKSAQVQNHQSVFTTAQNMGDQNGERLLDLRVDTAFKHVFGQKVFMLHLLNALLVREDKIADIVYNPTEALPAYNLGKKVIFDLKCTTERGEIFIVEMQYNSQPYFKERALYYMARTLDDQLRTKDKEITDAKDDEERKKKWKKYKLDPVYGVFITNFRLEQESRVIRDVVLCDQLNEGKRFSDILRMFFLELPSLTDPSQCDTILKKWIYVINNFRTMEKMPFTEEFPVFAQLREKAREFNLTKEEQVQYEYELRNFIAYDGGLFLAEENGFRKGEAKGRAEAEAKAQIEKLETARKLISEEGWSVEKAASFLGLSPEEITQD